MEMGHGACGSRSCIVSCQAEAMAALARDPAVVRSGEAVGEDSLVDDGVLAPSSAARRRLVGKRPRLAEVGQQAMGGAVLPLQGDDPSVQPVQVDALAAGGAAAEAEAAPAGRGKRQCQQIAWSRMRNLYVKDCLGEEEIRNAAAGAKPSHGGTWRSNRNRLQRLYQKVSAADRATLARRCAEQASQAGEPHDIIAVLEEIAEAELRQEVIVERRMGALLTYNGDWGILQNVLIPALPVGENWVEHVCRTLLPLPAVSDICAAFRGHVEKIVKHHKLSRWSCCIEVCPESIPTQQHVLASAQPLVCEELRVHGHVWLEATKAFSLHSRARDLLFRGVLPHCSDEQYSGLGGRGRGHKSAMAAGHYYCQAPKLSRVWGASSHCVHATHGLKAEWVTSYWSTKKMSDEAAIREYLHVRRDVKRHIQNVHDVAAFSRHQEGVRRATAVKARLAQAKAPRVSLPEVDDLFLKQFQDETLHRRKFLVLDGGSGFGKTEFARSLARSPLSYIELNCAHTEWVDLRAFSPDDHDLILWDECPAKLVLQNKKLFQGQASEVMLGQTNTSQHAYTVFVWNVKMIVCTNLWQLQLRTLSREDADWLEQNSIYVHVKAPLWRSPLGGQ